MKKKLTERQQTDNIEIQVQAYFLEKQSDPTNNKYAFAYTISITNHGKKNYQLITRHWMITESDSSIQEVHGEGVIGKQPNILPGATFVYTSGAILKTEVGTMKGFYDLVSDEGEVLKAQIPQFTLSIPRVLQ